MMHLHAGYNRHPSTPCYRWVKEYLRLRPVTGPLLYNRIPARHCGMFLPIKANSLVSCL